MDNNDNNLHSLESVQQRIYQAILLLREAIEISLVLKKQGTEVNKNVCKLWELFLGDFFGYIRQRSKETKQNLLAGINFPKIG